MTLHDVLHGFCAGRGTGTAIIELNRIQVLTSMDQYPLFLVFPDLRKVYDSLVWGRILKTIGGYRGRAKNAGHYHGVLGAAGGGHPKKLVPKPPVQGNPWNHTRGTDIYNTI